MFEVDEHWEWVFWLEKDSRVVWGEIVFHEAVIVRCPIHVLRPDLATLYPKHAEVP